MHDAVTHNPPTDAQTVPKQQQPLSPFPPVYTAECDAPWYGTSLIPVVSAVYPLCTPSLLTGSVV